MNTEIIPLTTGFLLCGHRDILQGNIYTYDITLTRFDNSGNLVWAKAFGTSFLDFVCSAAVIASNGDIIVAGNLGAHNPPDYDPMLARFDLSGNLIWMKYFYDPTGFFIRFVPTDMCTTSDGNYAITGFSDITFSNYDPHVIKFDENGKILWAKRLYQIGWHEYGNSITCNSQNEIVAGGHYVYGSDHGNFFSRFNLAGAYLGTYQIKNTYRNLTAPFIDVDDSHGNDLYERPGYGYAYSTCYYHNDDHHSQCLVTVDYAGSLNCPSLGGTYPFTVSDITWTVSSHNSLPTAQTNISASASNISASVISETQTNFCLFVDIENTNVSETIQMFPNPVTDELKIIGTNINGILKIMDTYGRVVYHHAFNTDVNIHHVNVTALSDGMHWLQWYSDTKKWNATFVKK